MIALAHDWLTGLRDLPGRWRFRQALKARTLTPPHDPVLAFGEPADSLGGIVHGGRVKLLHLAEEFSRDEQAFSLLYLVSSAIPRHAEELVAWARVQGAKLVWNQNGVGFPAWAGARTGIVNRRMRRLRAQADFIVYQSDFCRLSAERYLGPAAAPFQVLYNPVDLAAFSPAPAPPARETIRLLAAGTHNQPFRVLGAVETVRRLRAQGHSVHLTVAGALNWPSAAADVSLAVVSAGLSEHVELRPRFSQAEAVDLLRASHVLLHLKYHDPCPTMVIEALACGVPVIGSHTGGLPELIGKNAGELLPVPQSWRKAAYPKPAVLAEAVLRIMAEWPERSAAARARAERTFAREPWLAAHREIFSKVLHTGGTVSSAARGAEVLP